MKFEKEQGACETQTTREQVITTTSFSSAFNLGSDTTNPQPGASNLPTLSIFSGLMLTKKEDEAIDIIKDNITSDSTPIEKIPIEATSLQSGYCLSKSDMHKPTCENLRKHILERLKVNRTFAAVARRELRKQKKKANVKNGRKDLFLKFKEEFLISPISSFIIKSEKSSHLETSPESHALFENQEVESLDKKETMEEEDRSPRTPQPNAELRAKIRERNEQAPYPKWMIHAPSYVYNSDDDLLESCLNPGSKNSLCI